VHVTVHVKYKHSQLAPTAVTATADNARAEYNMDVIDELVLSQE